MLSHGVIHIVLTHKGGGGGVVKPKTYNYVLGGRGVLKVAYVRDKKEKKIRPQNLKTFLFCTKEAITLPFITVYRKV